MCVLSANYFRQDVGRYLFLPRVNERVARCAQRNQVTRIQQQPQSLVLVRAGERADYVVDVLALFDLSLAFAQGAEGMQSPNVL